MFQRLEIIFTRTGTSIMVFCSTWFLMPSNFRQKTKNSKFKSDLLHQRMTNLAP